MYIAVKPVDKFYLLKMTFDKILGNNSKNIILLKTLI